LNRLITTFDEVHTKITPAIHIAGDPISMKRSWCNLIQNVYRRSLSSGPDFTKTQGFHAAGTRKDSAVHVSLSSSSLVKQPGAMTPLPMRGEPCEVFFDGK